MCDVIARALAAGTVSRRSLLTAAAAGTVAAGVTAAAPVARSAEARPPAGAGRGHRTRLVLLGTSGGPSWWDPSHRAGPCSALYVGDRFYVIDAGEGVGRRIEQVREEDPNKDDEPLVAMRGIFLTHLHSDHVADLNNLLTIGLFEGLDQVDRKVQIWGPGNRGALVPLFGPAPAPPVVAPESPTPGTREMVEHLVRAFATDYNDRARDNRRHVPSQLFEGHDVPIPRQYTDDPNGDPTPRMSPVPFFEDDRVRVSATLVQHAPAFPALAYRFDTEDGSVVFSGDTSPTPNLIELAQGADVLVHELMSREWAEELVPEPRNEQQEALFQHLIGAHTTIEQVGPIAEEAGVHTLALNHLVPGNLPDREWRRAGRGFRGRLVVGNDLDQIPVRRRRRHHP